MKTEQDDEKCKSVSSVKKHEKERWMELVEEVVKEEKKPKHSAKIQNILQTLSTNIFFPKSEVEFFKFMERYCKDGYRDKKKSLKSVWNIIYGKLNNPKKKFVTLKTIGATPEKHMHKKLKNCDKKAAKQSEWFTLVGNVLIEQKDTAPDKVVKILKKISSIPTLPRKRLSFLKFVKHCNSHANDADIETTWNLLSAKLNDSRCYDKSPEPKEKQKVLSNSRENKSMSFHPYQTWLEQVERRSKEAESDASVDNSVKIILHRLTFYKNVPKKYNKFYSVIKRVLENSSNESIEAAYKYVSVNSPQENDEQREVIKNNIEAMSSSKISKLSDINTKIQAAKKEDVRKNKRITRNVNEKLEDIDNDDDEIPNSQEIKVIPLKATPKRNKKLMTTKS